ncbi:MAG: hypothetical protein EOS73_03075 [Mesorhizobium sp.]|uniref:hypothetical protein n=1 Tax=unclassified Mesorhizobium TaxID=325217 RepID=UPI000FC9BFA0|nr:MULTISPECIES: hypothetical protein [unclassified Mesorhizobium]RUV39175.1 hypothetical protein EOB49_03015 [Mesorhizobium sp. M7A.F.Ca.MR.148.00.0.0]RUT81253.1 hypothetical protein EOD14_31175 [Mesorhizobium sp. M7A.T.Ca.US.000.02.1.1]RUT85072.1 hypothetical protein EOD15_27140 [Mesorhizobium sp. M7A.T.Ca.US.000.02.2.1]RVD16954.1 hypothetical protein EN749_10605 [Mesorhizobium sp. M7A.F.Ca.ET.027.02.1.1]RWD12962.1 MAG: hypothetical protein EOS73_03075 [Mesorhizobium sp.]
MVENEKIMSYGFASLLLLAILLPLYCYWLWRGVPVLISALKTKTLKTRTGLHRKSEDPGIYWLGVGFYILALTVIPLCIFSIVYPYL